MKTLIASLTLLMALTAYSIAQGEKTNDSAAIDAASTLGQKYMGNAHVYKKADGQELKLYVMTPPDWKATDKRPAAVFYHGGGWIGGQPTQFNYQGHHLTTRGMVVVQVQYRLVNKKGEVPLNACLDARSSMRWVRSHAAELGIDPDRIAAGGGSAGGHLASYLGMVDGKDDPQDDLSISPKPNALLLFNPALLHGQERPDAPAEGRSAFEPISPWKNVSRDDPPGLILVGSEDGLLLPAKVKEFQNMCQAAGVRMDATIYPGEGHGFFGIGRSRDRFYDTVRETEKFLASLGWITGEPTLTHEQVTEYARMYKQANGVKEKKPKKKKQRKFC
ncbi:acetyl esterase/lipase [Prosthecobacter fusiformis]|uniref:Acetyl esterase/lipase n=1 Tax=Prosthecobacter fusiformis TaxID=48464 RepID=A0A4R7RLV1_9BACT|nr:alpha/beta hydrolase [Prosthecobacter fusiformis]TDU63134.1 acetyl esterase/lipase [Prosthecobacter fusiformis]